MTLLYLNTFCQAHLKNKYRSIVWCLIVWIKNDILMQFINVPYVSYSRAVRLNTTPRIAANNKAHLEYEKDTYQIKWPGRLRKTPNLTIIFTMIKAALSAILRVGLTGGMHACGWSQVYEPRQISSLSIPSNKTAFSWWLISSSFSQDRLFYGFGTYTIPLFYTIISYFYYRYYGNWRWNETVGLRQK